MTGPRKVIKVEGVEEPPAAPSKPVEETKAPQPPPEEPPVDLEKRRQELVEQAETATEIEKTGKLDDMPIDPGAFMEIPPGALKQEAESATKKVKAIDTYKEVQESIAKQDTAIKEAEDLLVDIEKNPGQYDPAEVKKFKKELEASKKELATYKKDVAKHGEYITAITDPKLSPFISLVKEFTGVSTFVLTKPELKLLKKNHPEVYKMIRDKGLFVASRKYGDIIEKEIGAKLPPFMTLQDGEILVNIVTALQVGVSPKSIKKLGFTDADIKKARAFIAENKELLKERGKAVREKREAEKKLAKYKVGEGHNIVKALIDGVPEKTLKQAGYSKSQVATAKEIVPIYHEKASLYDQSLKTMEPYKLTYTEKQLAEFDKLGMRPPEISAYNVRDALLSWKVPLEQMYLLFGKSEVEALREHVRPSPKPYEKKAKPAKKAGPEDFMVAAAPVVIAEPTPIGELALIIVMGGWAAYSAFKASQGQRVNPAVKKAVEGIETKKKRGITPKDIMQLMPTLMLPEGAKLGQIPPFTPSKVKTDIPPFIARKIEAKVPAMVPPKIKLEVPPTKPAAIKPAVILPGAKPMTREARDLILKATAPVADAEEELLITISPKITPPSELGKNVPATTSEKGKALVALDDAVAEALQKGQITDKEHKAYQAARERYVTRKGQLDAAIQSYIGGMTPPVAGIPPEVVSAISMGMIGNINYPYYTSPEEWQRHVEKSWGEAWEEAMEPIEKWDTINPKEDLRSTIFDRILGKIKDPKRAYELSEKLNDFLTDPTKAGEARLALDRAIADARKKGEITAKDVSKYKRVRDNYLSSLNLLQVAMSQYIGGMTPHLPKGVSIKELTSLATTYFAQATNTVLDEATKKAIKAFNEATEKGATSTQATTAAQNAAQKAVQEATKSAVKGATKAITRTATRATVQSAVQQAMQTATQTLAQQATQTAVQTASRVATKTAIETATTAPARPPWPPKEEKDIEKRRRVKKADGAIAFRMGELQGKDVWHVIMKPYEREEDHVVVLGRKPVGATIVRGPQSAYESAQLLYGIAPTKQFMINIGFQKALISPSGKGVKLGFTPDISITSGDAKVSQTGKVFPLRRGKENE